MLPVERRDKILEIVAEHKVISIDNLVNKFDVGEMTIRRDIKSLEDKGLLERVHGGVRSVSSSNGEPSLGMRQTTNLQEKAAIAEKAVKLIENGDIIFLDAGSTAYEIAKRLNNKKDITVITNGLSTALELSKNLSTTVIMVGGVIRDVSISTVGPLALDNLGKLSADKAFITCRGIIPGGEVLDSNLMEVDVKRQMIDSSDQVILVTDHTKFNKRSLTELVGLDRINTIITDSGAPKDSLKKLEEQKIEIIVAEGK